MPLIVLKRVTPGLDTDSAWSDGHRPVEIALWPEEVGKTGHIGL